MIVVNEPVVQRGGYVEWEPIDTGIQNVDAKTVDVTYGNKLTLASYRSFMFIVTLLNEGGTNPTVGAGKITANLWSGDGLTPLVSNRDIVVDFPLIGETAGTPGLNQVVSVVTWDFANAAGPIGLALVGAGTVTSQGLICLGRVSFGFHVTTATDGTSTSLASLTVRAAP